MIPANQGNPAIRVRGLSHSIVEEFSRRIRAKELQPGDKLPTEAVCMQAFGVSRTVIREAMSRLQASGWVETRHGIGTFVVQAPAAGLRLAPRELAESVDVLAMLELRISLETEAAGLAAARRTDAQLATLRSTLSDFERERGQAAGAASADFRFHLQIAEATGNRYFSGILHDLGTAIIPRTRIRGDLSEDDRQAYLQRVNREHEEIVAAIARRDEQSARAAMRIHLTNSRERLRAAFAATTGGGRE